MTNLGCDYFVISFSDQRVGLFWYIIFWPKGVTIWVNHFLTKVCDYFEWLQYLTFKIPKPSIFLFRSGHNLFCTQVCRCLDNSESLFHSLAIWDKDNASIGLKWSQKIFFELRKFIFHAILNLYFLRPQLVRYAFHRHTWANRVSRPQGQKRAK